jgi:hypothetical protein
MTSVLIANAFLRRSGQQHRRKCRYQRLGPAGDPPPTLAGQYPGVGEPRWSARSSWPRESSFEAGHLGIEAAKGGSDLASRVPGAGTRAEREAMVEALSRRAETSAGPPAPGCESPDLPRNDRQTSSECEGIPLVPGVSAFGDAVPGSKATGRKRETTSSVLDSADCAVGATDHTQIGRTSLNRQFMRRRRLRNRGNRPEGKVPDERSGYAIPKVDREAAGAGWDRTTRPIKGVSPRARLVKPVEEGTGAFAKFKLSPAVVGIS